MAKVAMAKVAMAVRELTVRAIAASSRSWILRRYKIRMTSG
jgi:hypothetical protein